MCGDLRRRYVSLTIPTITEYLRYLCVCLLKVKKEHEQELGHFTEIESFLQGSLGTEITRMSDKTMVRPVLGLTSLLSHPSDLCNSVGVRKGIHDYLLT